MRFWLLRYYPFLRPRARVLAWLPPVPADCTALRDRFGCTYVSFPRGQDHVVKSMYYLGDFDPWVNATLLHCAGLGDVVCDVGAFIGDTALPVATHVGPQGRVFAFEASPVNTDRLRQNISASGLTNVAVCPTALSDTDQPLRFAQSDDQPGTSRVNADGQTEVAAQSFDQWREAQCIETVRVCKIDVEGHETAVVRGMQRSLADHAIDALVFERHGGLGPGDALYDQLTGHGYALYQIRVGLRALRYVKLPKPDARFDTPDYVAALPGSVAARRLKLVQGGA